MPNGYSGLTLNNKSFAVGAGGAQRVSFEGRTQGAVETLLKADNKTVVDENFEDFNSGFASTLLRMLTGSGSGPLSSGLAFIRDLFKIRWDQADETAESVVSVGTQVHYVQEIISLQSGMGVWETGPDRTGTVSFPFGLLNLHAHTQDLYFDSDPSQFGVQRQDVLGTIGMTVPTVNATSTYAPWANVIFKSAAERKVVTFLANRTGTVSTFHIDIYKLEADGSSTLVHSSANLAGNLTTTLSWQQYLMPTGIQADLGDSYDVQFRMTGSGTVVMAGVNFPNPIPLPGFRPYASGSGRNPSTTPAPATIPTSTRDTMYVGPTPFVSLGIDVGQTVIPRFTFDDFNRTSLGSRWTTYGSIGISSNRVQHTGGALANNSAAAMSATPMSSDAIEVAADLFVDTHAVGVGLCMAQGMTGGAWLTIENNDSEFSGLRIMTGHYDSRTARATLPGQIESGRYTLRYTPSDNTYRAYFGSMDDNPTPILQWVDSGNVVQHGIGRRWVGVVARRAFTFASGRLDNFTAADVAA
ncbi:minor tail protein [Gordonia phage Rabbitrun]|uniref:Minor tail protein n=1 Tax=Gordonia phage Rabbitrun TaxID=2762280 RepID=A0A7G8LIK4_9CAUD|nr:minor tail protein [Gordonia phage Rabbitrun]QNJ57076.1 minor tail protein [Gordonia phage Rabbitrun]